MQVFGAKVITFCIFAVNSICQRSFASCFECRGGDGKLNNENVCVLLCVSTCVLLYICSLLLCVCVYIMNACAYINCAKVQLFCETRKYIWSHVRFLHPFIIKNPHRPNSDGDFTYPNYVLWISERDYFRSAKYLMVRTIWLV